MRLVTSSGEARTARRALAGTVGLVPTMGALHAGHLSLVRRARDENAHVAASVFVNPAQFGPKEDLASYPRPLERDLELLEKEGVALVLVPEPAAMYPAGFETWVEPGPLAARLEGERRPGHFRGVLTVVAKLLNAFEPDRAYFGQKDAQQVAVVRRLAQDLDLAVEVRVCPTVRESDGLAMSSRNAYLDPIERVAAGSLSDALRLASKGYAAGERDPGQLRKLLLARLEAEPLARVDYAEVVDPETFSGPGNLAVLAVWIGKTRLIDNHDLAKAFPG